MKVPKKITLLTTLFCIGFTYCQEKKAIIADSLIWRKGYLDIHFIHTGKGNASFMVFPDGTTLLYDAGDSISGGKKPRYPSFESDSFTVGQIIHKYIKAFSPNQEIDYALISHFHADHYGALRNGLIKSNKGDFYLTGITEVGELIPIKKLIDRGYPNYDYPIDRRFKPGDKSTLKSKEKDSTFLNYLSYIQTHQKQGGLVVEKFLAGSNRQIKMVNSPESYPEFSVQNIKVNNRIWTGNGNNIRELEFKPPLINKFGYYNENPLSLALKIVYGDFDYYVGGDTSGVDDYPDYDIESEMIEIIGEVDAMTLDHHGYKDASNTLFLKHLKPQVIAHQSLHDPHFSENIQQNLLKTKSDVFSLFIGDKIKNKYGNQIDTIYKQKKGHFFIRVYPKGQKFEVITLKPDSSLSLNKKYGPYTSKK